MPPIYFLRWGNARPLDGVVKTRTRSEARAEACHACGLKRFPEGGVIEELVRDVTEDMIVTQCHAAEGMQR